MDCHGRCDGACAGGGLYVYIYIHIYVYMYICAECEGCTSQDVHLWIGGVCIHGVPAVLAYRPRGVNVQEFRPGAIPKVGGTWGTRHQLSLVDKFPRAPGNLYMYPYPTPPHAPLDEGPEGMCAARKLYIYITRNAPHIYIYLNQRQPRQAGRCIYIYPL
jgi:hypothetical protein